MVKFLVCCFHFHLSQVFFIFLLVPLWLFVWDYDSIFIYLWIFNFTSVIDFQFHTMWQGEKDAWYHFNFLKLKVVLWLDIWSMMEDVSCILKKNEHILLLFDGTLCVCLCVCIRPMLFKFTLFLFFIFCLSLFVIKNGILLYRYVDAWYWICT